MKIYQVTESFSRFCEMFKGDKFMETYRFPRSDVSNADFQKQFTDMIKSGPTMSLSKIWYWLIVPALSLKK